MDLPYGHKFVLVVENGKLYGICTENLEWKIYSCIEMGIFPYGIGECSFNVMNIFNARCPRQDTHFVKQVHLVRGKAPKTPDN